MTPLLFLPGWLCDGESWRASAERLSDVRDCATLDLPGFGGAAAGARRDWTIAGFADDVVAALSALPQGRAVLVGHSMGAAVAVEAAILAPDRVDRVIAVDGLVHAAIYDAMPEHRIDDVLAGYAGDFASAVRDVMQAYVLDDRNSDVRAAIDAMAAADPQRGIAVMRDFLRWDVDSRVAAADVPMSIIAAAAFLTEDAAERWRDHDLVEISNVGHFVMLDDPAGFDRALSRILSGPDTDVSA